MPELRSDFNRALSKAFVLSIPGMVLCVLFGKAPAMLVKTCYATATRSFHFLHHVWLPSSYDTYKPDLSQSWKQMLAPLVKI